MSIRLNKALRELNIGFQTAVEFLEKRSDIGEEKLELTSKISDAQYSALVEAFKQDAAVRNEAERLLQKKTKDKKRAPEAKDNRAESLLESSSQQQYKPLGKIDLDSIGKPVAKSSGATEVKEEPKPKAAAVSQAKEEPAPKKSEPKKEETVAKKETVSEESEQLKKLRELMEKDDIDEDRLIYAVASKGGCFTGESITKLDPEYIQKMLIDKWTGFCKYAKKLDITMEEIPFK